MQCENDQNYWEYLIISHLKQYLVSGMQQKLLKFAQNMLELIAAGTHKVYTRYYT